MDSQFQSKFTFTADKGVWLDDALGGLRAPEGMATAAPNFHFFDGAAVSRMGLADKAITESGNFLWARPFAGGANPHDSTGLPTIVALNVVFFESAYYLLGYDPAANTYTLTPVTGPAFTSVSILDTSADFINLELVVGGSKASGATGLHAIVGTAYTEIAAGENWYFVVGHKSRAIVALENGAANGPWAVAWTVPGTNSNFTGFGSGNVVLADSLDSIAGLLNIRDHPIIARGGGFTIMYPTGQADPAFDLRNFTKDAQIGVRWAESLSSDGLTCYFVGEDDIFTFNLSEIIAIGRGIKKTFFNALYTYGRYRGKVLRSLSRDRRRVYILAPISGTTAAPIFVYDIEQQTWQTWYFDAAMRYGVFDIINPGSTFIGYGWMPAFVDSSKHLRVMNKDLTCEKEVSIRFGPIRVGDFKSNYRVVRCWLSVVLAGSGGTINCNVVSRRGHFNDQDDLNYTVTSPGQAVGTLPTIHAFNVDQVGNYFTFTFTFPITHLTTFESFQVEFAEAGELR